MRPLICAMEPSTPGSCKPTAPGLFRFGTVWRQAVTGLLLAMAQTWALALCGSPDAPLEAVMPGVAVRHGGWPTENPEGRPHWASSVVLWRGRHAVVLDPGPSHCSGRQLQDALDRLAGGPVQVDLVINTHAHAEQVLANSAWPAPVAALAGTQAAMRQRCRDCLAAITQDLGEAAMAGSRIVLPERLLEPGAWLELAGRRWQVLHMSMAHTESDLVLWSPAEGVLLAGGLLDGRHLVLAQGRITGWLQALAHLEALRPRWLIGQHLVAGPGEVAHALQRQRQALCALVRLSWEGLEGWQTEAQVLAQLPPTSDETERRLQAFNLQRAWREMEGLWLGHEAMPAACQVQPQTSGGN